MPDFKARHDFKKLLVFLAIQVWIASCADLHSKKKQKISENVDSKVGQWLQ